MPAWFDIVWLLLHLRLCYVMLMLLYSKSTTAPQMRFRLMKTWMAFLPAETTSKVSSTMKSALEHPQIASYLLAFRKAGL